MKVQNFIYNGLFIIKCLGFTDYEAEFVEWSDDPGMALMNCSDGKQRLIPSFCIDGNLPPEPDYSAMHDENSIIMGQPSSSK